MASYQIRWKRSASRELKKLPVAVIPRIVKAVEGLATDPRPAGIKKLTGTDHTYRLRVGDYRVLYTIEDEILLIQIVRTGHRRDVYR